MGADGQERVAACGHDPAQFVTADEGTSYCPACEDEARSAASVIEQLRHDTEVELGEREGDCLMPRDAYYEAVANLIQAVESIDAPYPIEVFPDLQKRDEVFAAMREVNRYATEQFYAEVARARGVAARSYFGGEDGKP
ncbi:MAG TPA: hypothetical protein VFH56_12680 [Acidimicrobiales bacterium]|nr:hypothetical protein [Acidimicrobiales bacterium]